MLTGRSPCTARYKLPTNGFQMAPNGLAAFYTNLSALHRSSIQSHPQIVFNRTLLLTTFSFGLPKWRRSAENRLMCAVFCHFPQTFALLVFLLTCQKAETNLRLFIPTNFALSLPLSKRSFARPDALQLSSRFHPYLPLSSPLFLPLPSQCVQFVSKRTRTK